MGSSVMGVLEECWLDPFYIAKHVTMFKLVEGKISK